MELKPGTYTFGSGGGTLLVKTGRAGAAFLVGQNLTIEVTSWEGELEIGEDGADARVELTADGGSLKLTGGKGGPVTLSDVDKESLSKTINEEVLEGAEIRFRSDSASPSEDGSCIEVTGKLRISGEETSLEFQLTVEQEDEEDSEEDSEESEEHEDSREDEDPGEDEEDEDSDEDEPQPDQWISGRAAFKQSDVGLEPHSTLFGLLRVRDEVEVTFEGKLER